MMNDRFGIQVRSGCMCAHTYAHYIFGLNKKESDEIANLVRQGSCSLKPGWVRYSFYPTMADWEVQYICDSIKQLVKNYKSWKDDYTYVSSTNEFVNCRDKDPVDFHNKLLML
jgi:selenocysteine lyase/cysteine desulfurase